MYSRKRKRDEDYTEETKVVKKARKEQSDQDPFSVLARLRVVDLRKRCKEYGLSPSGLKVELIKRIMEFEAHTEEEDEVESSSLRSEDSSKSDKEIIDLSLEYGSSGSDTQNINEESGIESSSMEIDLSSLEESSLQTSFEYTLEDSSEENKTAEKITDTPNEKKTISSNSTTNSCEHINSFVQRKKIQSSLLNPVNWNCKECGTTESMWACLFCGQIYCGPEAKDHAKRHFRHCKHPLYMDVNSTKTYCFSCSSLVSNDNSEKDILQLGQCLKALAEQDFDKGDENSSADGIPNRTLKRRASQYIMQAEDIEVIDCFATSVQHWRNNYLTRGFKKWKEFVNQRRLINLATSLEDFESSESDDETNESTEVSFPVPQLKNRRITKKNNIPEIPIKSSSICSPITRKETVSIDISELITNSKMTPRLPVLVPSSPSILLTPGQTGLRNLGNSCFMNAVLQALSNISQLRDYFTKDLLPAGREIPLGRQMVTRADTTDCLRDVHDKELIKTLSEEQISMCLELHKLLRVMWSGKNAIVTPYSLFYSLWKVAPAFSNYKQQDAEELLCFMFTKIEEELANAFQKQKTKRDTIIHELFGGMLNSSITCSVCSKSSIREEEFYNIGLNIPSEYASLGRSRRCRKTTTHTCSLELLIKSYLSKEDLCGYKCSFCSAESCTKQYSFQRFPTVLCLVIKRFYWGERGKAKINTRIQYPFQLQFSTSKTRHKFQLKAVVLHHGNTLNVGHYTALVHNDLKDQWFDCNDKVVKPIKETQVRKEDNSPYILFYIKT